MCQQGKICVLNVGREKVCCFGVFLFVFLLYLICYITGMRGSCIIIPCRFSYSRSQPAGLRVIWYLLTNGYSPVFDESQNVNSKFSGITSLTGSVRKGNCSLKIERLEMSHSQDRLYPWVDNNPITSYYTAQEPQFSITDIPREGEQSRVSCNVRHTCISDPPTLTISGILGADCTVDTLVSDGIWERKVERTWTVKEDDQSVKCTVSYRGGQTAKSELRLNVECTSDLLGHVQGNSEGRVPQTIPGGCL
uniref:Immunoglobulin V-set domain-containing protein n=1 Tax=Mola mola TaxID=94237 RepID=A0A3Q3XE84_MOLML